MLSKKNQARGEEKRKITFVKAPSIPFSDDLTTERIDNVNLEILILRKKKKKAINTIKKSQNLSWSRIKNELI